MGGPVRRRPRRLGGLSIAHDGWRGQRQRQGVCYAVIAPSMPRVRESHTRSTRGGECFMYWRRPEESNQVKTRVPARIFGNGVGSVGCRE